MRDGGGGDGSCLLLEMGFLSGEYVHPSQMVLVGSLERRLSAPGVLENQKEWFLPEVLLAVGTFVPLDGSRLMLTCCGGLAAVRKRFGRPFDFSLLLTTNRWRTCYFFDF